MDQPEWTNPNGPTRMDQGDGMNGTFFSVFLGILLINSNIIMASSNSEPESFSVSSSSGEVAFNLKMVIPAVLKKEYEKKKDAYLFTVEDEGLVGTVLFQIADKKITPDFIRKAIETFEMLSAWHEGILEIRKQRFYGYSILLQYAAQKKIGLYSTKADLIIDNTIWVSISIISRNKDKNNQMLNDIYISLENMKIDLPLKGTNPNGTE